jgi:TctA family transporter
MVLENAWEALLVVLDLGRLSFIVLGVLIGLIVGVIPGVGGLVGLALVLPFTISMDHFTALGFLIGLSAVTVTSDTIPAVLFGVPGTVGSAATVLDGHPMARKGEAGRAFGAAFSASVLGGLFGAFLLGVSVPVLRPLMLAVGSPELLAICLLGLTLVSSLSGGAILKGLVAACLGILLAQVGDEPQTGEMRWSGDSLYLLDGFPLVPVALAMFAIPELIDLAISRLSIASGDPTKRERWQQLQGVKDTLRNWWLVVRCSAIGSLLGAIPGIGASIIDWIAYGYAARACKGASETFGTGDVRGVIASESSNNAKEGGALVPTLAFGVPGSASMALLLGAFLMHGITPGPKLLTEQLDITYALVWSVAIANIIGASLCFAFADQFAKIARMPATVLMPLVLAITFIGAYQGSRDLDDLTVLVAFGVVAWVMKRQGWPRPPVILGFVLGDLIERYMFISYNRYQFDFVTHPGVIAIGAVLIIVLLRPLVAGLFGPRRERTAASPGASRSTGAHIVGLAIWASAAAVFAYAFYSSSFWPFAAKLMPQLISGAGLAFVMTRAAQGVIEMLRAAPANTPAPPDVKTAQRNAGPAVRENDPLSALPNDVLIRRATTQLLWIIGLMALIHGIGMLPGIALFVAAYLLVEARLGAVRSLATAIIYILGMFVLFGLVLHMPWPTALIGDIWPELRHFWGLRLV